MWGSKCPSIHPKSKRERCWRAWLNCQAPLGQSLSHYEGSTVAPLSLQCDTWDGRWLFACSRCTCEGLFISVALIQIAGQLDSSTAVIHSLHYVAANKSTAQHQQMKEAGKTAACFCQCLGCPHDYPHKDGTYSRYSPRSTVLSIFQENFILPIAALNKMPHKVSFNLKQCKLIYRQPDLPVQHKSY